MLEKTSYGPMYHEITLTVLLKDRIHSLLIALCRPPSGTTDWIILLKWAVVVVALWVPCRTSGRTIRWHRCIRPTQMQNWGHFNVGQNKNRRWFHRELNLLVYLKSIHLHTVIGSRVGFGLSCTVSLTYQSINLCQPLDAPQPPWLLPSILSPVTVTTAE